MCGRQTPIAIVRLSGLSTESGVASIACSVRNESFSGVGDGARGEFPNPKSDGRSAPTERNPLIPEQPSLENNQA